MELSGMDGPPEEILGGFAEVVARSSSDLWPLVLSADSSWLRHLKIGYTVYLKIPCIIHDNSHFPHEHCLFDGWIIGPWRTSQVVWLSSRTSACPLWRAKLAAGIATQQPPPVASWAPSPGSRPVARPAQHHTREGPWGTAMQHNGCGVAVEVLVTWWLWMFFSCWKWYISGRFGLPRHQRAFGCWPHRCGRSHPALWQCGGWYLLVSTWLCPTIDSKIEWLINILIAIRCY